MCKPVLKALCLLSIAILFSAVSFSQKVKVIVQMEHKKANAKSDTIYYELDQKLTWQDFQGVPQLSSNAGAVTSSGFAFNSQMEYDGHIMTLYINVYSYFNKKKSWKKKEFHSAYHLEHEQHHFDITRLSAENLYIEFKKAKFTPQNVNALTTAIYNKVYEQHVALQKQYDAETKNSINQEKQLEWNQKINARLQQLRS